MTLKVTYQTVPCQDTIVTFVTAMRNVPQVTECLMDTTASVISTAPMTALVTVVMPTNAPGEGKDTTHVVTWAFIVMNLRMVTSVSVGALAMFSTKLP